MKQQDITALSTKDLSEKLAEETASLSKLRLNHSVSAIENPMKINATRKTIARIKTELSKRAKAEASTK